MSFELLREVLRERAYHLSPFLVLGDPAPEVCLALARAAVGAGASMLELGFPYGDPVADGPAIQEADRRALEGGTSTEGAFRILSRIREACPRTPLNLLVYGNLVHARGYERFCRDAVAAGASSLLVPDIPLEEGRAMREASRRAGLGHVELVGPLTGPERLRRLDRAADAFVYLVAHQGVTGVRDGSFSEVARLVGRTAALLKNPLCLGFGLSRPEDLREAFRAGARIGVVGSYLARVIGKAWSDPEGHQHEEVVRRFSGALTPLIHEQTALPGSAKN